MENGGAKGRPFISIAPHQSADLLDVSGQGIIHRIWVTIDGQSAVRLRSLKIEMYWDGQPKPAVSVPFGDFFGIGLGRKTPFENVFFANAEGRSFNCFIPMPFKKGARIAIVNDADNNLDNVFFDVDYVLTENLDENSMYFHAFWHRDTSTTLTRDFEILPGVKGRGRFLGTNIGVSANLKYGDSWFGEGEVKIYKDGDKDYPTMNGTGTEDYIGTAWGQGKFIQRYTGCTIADDTLKQWAFYRYHVPDPIFFNTECKVTIQNLGGFTTGEVQQFQQSGAPVIPVTTGDAHGFNHIYNKQNPVKLDTTKGAKGWTNFYRSDDLSAVAYFYLDKPVSDLPPIQPIGIRTANLRVK